MRQGQECAIDAAGLQGDNAAIHELICKVTSSDRLVRVLFGVSWMGLNEMAMGLLVVGFVIA